MYQELYTSYFSSDNKNIYVITVLQRSEVTRVDARSLDPGE